MMWEGVPSGGLREAQAWVSASAKSSGAAFGQSLMAELARCFLAAEAAATLRLILIEKLFFAPQLRPDQEMMKPNVKPLVVIYRAPCDVFQVVDRVSLCLIEVHEKVKDSG
ncbi:hypothetical protein KL939_004505 [Ogataea angusta]|nr:hypothetical protein KL939_004505 [Ogataea angusta]